MCFHRPVIKLNRTQLDWKTGRVFCSEFCTLKITCWANPMVFFHFRLPKSIWLDVHPYFGPVTFHHHLCFCLEVLMLLTLSRIQSAEGISIAIVRLVVFTKAPGALNLDPRVADSDSFSGYVDKFRNVSEINFLLWICLKRTCEFLFCYDRLLKCHLLNDTPIKCVFSSP